MSRQPSNGPQLYEIRFRGHLDPSRAQMFEGLEMVQKPGGDTVLTGVVIDQAALHGVLNRIRDLGLPLLSVKWLLQDEAVEPPLRSSSPRAGGPAPPRSGWRL